jgi:diaminopimelate decarboxylase
VGPDHDAAQGELIAWARRLGTPCYLYSRQPIRDRLARLRDALSGLPRRLHYAMKANRHPEVLACIRAEGDVGIDACSPREVALALEAGFAAGEISVTAGMPSNRDLAAFARTGVHVNLDTLSAIRRFGAVAPAGTAIGLRLDPGAMAGWGGNARLAYGAGKFGLAEEALPAALDACRAAGLTVDTLHVHCGWNLQRAVLPDFERALAMLGRLAGALSIPTINVGGGLGVRFRPDDDPLPVEEWAAALRRHLAAPGRTIACEPGTFVVAEAGVLVAEVNTVERRGDITWIGVDCGHNVNVYAAHYGIPLRIALLGARTGGLKRYAVAGNINEANDVFAMDALLPEPREGDLLAFFPAGAYGSSMASDHCLRGWAAEAMMG